MLLHSSTTGRSRKEPRAGKHVPEKSICSEMGMGIYKHKEELAHDSGRVPPDCDSPACVPPDTPTVPRTGTTVHQWCTIARVPLLQHDLSKWQLEGHFWQGLATGAEWAGPGTRALQRVQTSPTWNFPSCTVVFCWTNLFIMLWV